MGLDIHLIQLSRKATDELRFLYSEDNHELLERFPEMEVARLNKYSDETGTFEFGFYYHSLAYQRKGVIKAFYQRFGYDGFLFTQSEMEELFNYISNDHKTSFQSDFLFQFSEGETILMIDG